MRERRSKTYGFIACIVLAAVLAIIESVGGRVKEETQTVAPAAEDTVTEADIAETAGDSVRTGITMEESVMDVMCAASGIAVTADGELLVTDTYNKVIWKVQDGKSTVYAGGDTVQDPYGQPLGGYNDAVLADSYFKDPWAITPFLNGWAVSDTKNQVVRLVQDDKIQTVNARTADGAVAEFEYPTGLASDEEGNLYVADSHKGVISKISSDGLATAYVSGLSEPTGLCWKEGILYVAESGKNRIIKLVDGETVLVSGDEVEGFEDGDVKKARFRSPQGVAVGEDGAVYVSDTGNSAVRCIRDGMVTTLAADDPALMNAYPVVPRSLLIQEDNLYVCDNFSRRVFVISLGS